MSRILNNVVTALTSTCLLTICGAAFAAELTTSSPQFKITAGGCNDNPNQVIKITNSLVNTQIPVSQQPGMTVTAVTFIDYDETGKECWRENEKLFFGQTRTIYSGNNCGCKSLISKIDVVPVARSASEGYPQDPKTVYLQYSIPIEKSFGTVMEIIQNQAPVFDVQSGLISNQGTMTFKKTNYAR